MEETLKTIFANINDWLRFAEAKNGAIIAVNGAAIFGILKSLTEDKDLKVLVCFILLLLIISICVIIYSFIPQLVGLKNYSKLSQEEFDKNKKELNSLFFGSLVNLTSVQFLDLISYKSAKEQEEIKGIHVDYANQIIINSEIAMTKFLLFRVASILTLGSFVLGLIALIIKITG
jgi:hypothetical protein